MPPRRVIFRRCAVCKRLFKQKSKKADARKTCSEECYRVYMSRYAQKADQKLRDEVALLKHPQYRKWDCVRYGPCLTKHAERNAPRWDCGVNCIGYVRVELAMPERRAWTVKKKRRGVR